MQGESHTVRTPLADWTFIRFLRQNRPSRGDGRLPVLVWYSEGTLFGQETVRETLTLTGGDDRIALLIAGMQIEGIGNISSNSNQQPIANFGDEALRPTETAIETTQESTRVPRSGISACRDATTAPNGWRWQPPSRPCGKASFDRALNKCFSSRHGGESLALQVLVQLVLNRRPSCRKDRSLDATGKMPPSVSGRDQHISGNCAYITDFNVDFHLIQLGAFRC